MALQPGSRLGPYEVQAPLGAGGMGEVYRATDTRLDRTVAIKVLPAELASDPERRGRFEREAKTISSLQHPHICTLHDVGHQDGIDYLVMEYLEGETLQDRLTRGALPLDQALRYAIEITDALDKAHRQGIVHRDLKPGNIMLTRAGAKLLDFGLAKLREPADAAGNLSALPTQEANLTAEGSIVGTFQYMAPEQFEASESDSRADIWAFGCVVYEMVTGTMAFEGNSQASLIGAILRDEPRALSALQPLSPSSLDRVIRKCLAKNPDLRWYTAHDLHDELVWIAEAGSQVAPPTPRRSGLFVGGAILLAATIGYGVGRIGGESVAVAPVPPTHLEVTLPAPQGLHDLAQRVLAISADGGQLAYVTSSPEAHIYVRRLDSMEAVLVPGSEGGTSPFFSPDGGWLGFWKDRQLYKVAVAGGAPIALCPARTVYGASWGPDDRIVFGQSHHGVFEVSADGGDPKLLVAPNPTDGEVAIDGPQLLPDGRSLLFSLLKTGQNWDGASIVVQHLETGERRVLVEDGTDARYVPSGHLLFVRERALYALPFDPDDWAVRGSPVPVVEDLWRAYMFETGAGQFSVSQNGTLVYVLAQPYSGSTLVWVDRTGAEEVLPMPPREYFHARLSPDGQRVVVDTVDAQDIWVYELARGTMARLTTEQTHLHPVWSADGTFVVFDADLSVALERKRVDSPAPAEPVAASDTLHLTAVSMSPDGQTLAVERSDDFFTYDIGVVSLDGDGTVRPLLADPEFRENAPVFSPDGRWLAYVSDETGQEEVYVQPYPELDRRTLISVGGGVEPMWSPTGTEIFYRTGPAGSRMMAVPVRTQAGFEAGEPQLLFAASPWQYLAEPVSAHPVYDVSRDGQRFLMTKSVESYPLYARINVVVNWFEELRARVPTAQ